MASYNPLLGYIEYVAFRKYAAFLDTHNFILPSVFLSSNTSNDHEVPLTNQANMFMVDQNVNELLTSDVQFLIRTRAKHIINDKSLLYRGKKMQLAS